MSALLHFVAHFCFSKKTTESISNQVPTLTSRELSFFLSLLINLFLFSSGTFYRHLESGVRDEVSESSTTQDNAQASGSNASDLSSTDDDNELSEPEEPMDHEPRS